MAENIKMYTFTLKKMLFFQLSILVHPDKNQDDADRAQKAFEGRLLVLQIRKGNRDNFPIPYKKTYVVIPH